MIMRVIVVSCVFPPEPVVSAQTSIQIAQNLINKGHKVSVFASFPNRPGGSLFSGYKKKLYSRERTPNGFELIRCFSTFSSNSSLISRFLENISFGIVSGLAVLFSKRPDVVYSNTWPIFATGLLFLITRLRRIPMIVSIQDIYPESLIVQSRIGEKSWIARLLRWIDRYIANGCQVVIVISKHFEMIYCNHRKVPKEKVKYIPNWVDENTLEILPRSNEIFKLHDVPDERFLLVYGGNVGVAAKVEVVIEAFRYLEQFEKFYLLIAGEGNNLESCQKLAQKVNPVHIKFHNPWYEEETSTILGLADVLVLPTQGNQSLASVPSKLISYMLSARPVLAQVFPESEVAEIIENSGCGWIVDPEQPELLASKIIKVSKLDPEELIRRGLSGRRYALANLSQKANLPKIISVIEHAASII